MRKKKLRKLLYQVARQHLDAQMQDDRRQRSHVSQKRLRTVTYPRKPSTRLVMQAVQGAAEPAHAQSISLLQDKLSGSKPRRLETDHKDSAAASQVEREAAC